ncbi:flagellar biosynthetic protein FliQ, partial [Pseudophaeobacter arcticus]
MVLSLGAQAIKTVMFLAGPLLVSAMIVGIIVSI